MYCSISPLYTSTFSHLHFHKSDNWAIVWYTAHSRQTLQRTSKGSGCMFFVNACSFTTTIIGAGWNLMNGRNGERVYNFLVKWAIDTHMLCLVYCFCYRFMLVCVQNHAPITVTGRLWKSSIHGTVSLFKYCTNRCHISVSS
jgi:hypothetical protein